MKKLSAIFDIVDTKEENYQQSLADKIVESYIFEQKLTETVSEYTSEAIENRIIHEAISMKTEAEALRFVDGIYNQLDEGFMDAMKSVGGAIKKGYNKVKDAIVNFFSNDVDVAIKKFHSDIVKFNKELKNNSTSVTEALHLLEASKKEAPVINIIKGIKSTEAMREAIKLVIANSSGKVILTDEIFGDLVKAEINIVATDDSIVLTLNKDGKSAEFLNIKSKIITAGGAKVTSNVLIAIAKYMITDLNTGKKIVLAEKEIMIKAGVALDLEADTTILLPKAADDAAKPADDAAKPADDAAKPADATKAPSLKELTGIEDDPSEDPEAKTKRTANFLAAFEALGKDEKDAWLDIDKLAQAKSIELMVSGKQSVEDITKAMTTSAEQETSKFAAVAQKIAGFVISTVDKPEPLKITGPKGLKSYKIITVGAERVLHMGEPGAEVPVLKYVKNKKIVALNPETILFPSQLEFLKALIVAIGTSVDVLADMVKDVTVESKKIKVGVKFLKMGASLEIMKGKVVAKTAGGVEDPQDDEAKAADDAAKPTDEEGKAKPTDEEGKAKPTDEEVNEIVLKKQFGLMLKSADFLGSVGKLKDKMKIDPASVNKNLDAMAKKYQYILPEVLVASSNNPQDYSPLKQNEFLAYMSTMSTILLKALTTFATNPKQYTPKIYSIKPYEKFLKDSAESAKALSAIVGNAKPVKDKNAEEDKPAKKVAPTSFELLYKAQPALAEALKNNVKSEKALLIYSKEIMSDTLNPKFKEKEASLVSIITDMKDVKFFNNVNPKAKINFVHSLFTQNLSDDNIKLILKSVMSHNVETNFDKVEPFNDTKTLAAAIGGMKPNEVIAYFDGMKSEIFNKSKF